MKHLAARLPQAAVAAQLFQANGSDVDV